ncbi:MAG TPA: hypothetical protein PKE12_11315 [Kiritimatiellia bacterium]|nr:hypothetical protein [Kiritimatiellia bacterium]
MRNTMMFITLLGMGLAGSSASASEPAAGLAQDHYRVEDGVALKHPPRFGVNVTFGSFAPWNVDQRVNAWNLFNSLEPMLLQYAGQCDGGGVDFAQHKSAPGFSFWDCARSGFWDGAEIRFYRIEGGVMTQLRTSRVTRSVTGKDPETGEKSDEILWLAEAGPAIQPGDFYVLNDRRTEFSPHIRPALLEDAWGSNFRLDGYCNFTGKLNWRFDTNTFAPEGGSTASLRMDLIEASPEKPAGPWHWFLINNSDEPHIHLRFMPGKQYRAQVWLRQEGMADPRAKIQFGCFTTHVVEVGTEWKKYEFDLPVDQPERPLPNRQNDGSRLTVAGYSPGTLWMDNLLVWQTDVEPHAIMPYVKDVLREFQPGVIRLWEGLTAPTLEAWLAGGFAQPALGRHEKSDRLPPVSLAQALELCKETGADPWLILNPYFTREEHLQLMEYLAGPPDIGHGRRRAQDGRREPWTTAFTRIHLECGNEMWNSIMPKNLSGQPEVYAAFADRQFRDLKSSAHYDAKKFEMIANGWDNAVQPRGWTHRVASNSRHADRVDLACYFGGWEAGASALASEQGATADVFQDKLFTTPIEFGRKMVQALVLDPGLTRALCGVLRDQPAMRAEGLATFEPRWVRWKDEQLAPPAAPTTAESVAGLWALDTNFNGSIRSVLNHRRKEMERVFWAVSHTVMATVPSLQPKARAALRLPDNELLLSLCEGLADPNAPSRLLPLMKTNSALIAAWLEGDFATGGARADLEAFAANGEKLTYNITNLLNQKLRDAITDAARAHDPAFTDALLALAVDERLRHGLRQLDYAIMSMFGEPTARRVEQLMMAMKLHPAFARDVVGYLAEDNNLFQTVARDAAAGFSTHMVQLFSGTASFSGEQDTSLLLNMVPAGVRSELLGRYDRLAAQMKGTLSQESQLLLTAMLSAALGDTAPAAALAEDPKVRQLMVQQMETSLPQPFLEAAKKDTAFGDRLLKEFAHRPSSTAKGLAIYEGGPGYSLPGPNRPPSDDDENIGKSLVMGTATLDCFMQFMALDVAPLGYYKFKSGSHWSSHNNPIDLIPYPSWLALQMVNREARGDLLRVARVDGVAVDVPDKEIMRTTNDGRNKPETVIGRKGIPLSACHVFRDDKRYSIVLINRDFEHARPIQVDLPEAGRQPTRIVALTHEDPRTHNRSAYNVRISEREGPPLARTLRITVPRASALVVVGEAD